MPDQIQSVLEHLLSEIAAARPRFDVVYHNRELWENFVQRIRRKLQESLGLGELPDSVSGTLLAESRDNGTVSEDVSFEPEPGLLQRIRLTRPEGLEGSAPAVLLLQPLRPASDESEWTRLIGGLLELRLVVAVLDAPARDHFVGGDSARLAAACALLGRPYLGQLVRDDCAALSLLEHRDDIQSDKIAVVGVGDAAFRAAALSCLIPSTAATVCAGGISSFRALCTKAEPSAWDARMAALIPPGLLRYVDQGQILACGVPRPLLVTSSKRDPAVPVAGAMESVGYTKRTYKGFDVEERLVHHISDADVPLNDGIREIISSFLEEHLGEKPV